MTTSGRRALVVTSRSPVGVTETGYQSRSALSLGPTSQQTNPRSPWSSRIQVAKRWLSYPDRSGCTLEVYLRRVDLDSVRLRTSPAADYGREVTRRR